MKKAKIALIFSIIFFLGTVGNIVQVTWLKKQSENNTTLYSATVAKVQIESFEGLYVSAEIKTEEYISNLFIPLIVLKNIRLLDINNLHEGQKIYFRVENSKVKSMNKVDFIDIVSLQTEEKDIFTLDDYNGNMKDFYRVAKVIPTVLALLFLLISITLLCVYLIIRKGGKTSNRFRHIAYK